MNKYISVVFFIFWGFVSFGQTNCGNLIVDARQLYKDGLYEEVVKVLKNGLSNCSLSGSDKAEAYKLMAASDYAMDELEEGDEYMIRFFKKKPNYLAKKGIDPSFFIEAFPKFKLSPKFTIYTDIAVPRYEIARSKVYAMWDAADYEQPYSTNSFPIPTVGIQWYPFRYFSLKIGISYNEFVYRREIIALEKVKLTYEEEAKSIGLPFSFNIDFPINKRVYPSLYFGMTLQRVFEVDADIAREFLGGKAPPARKLNGVDVSSRRNMINATQNIGIRLNYKVNNFIFHADVSYARPVLMYTNDEKYSEIRFINEYYYMDDDFWVSQTNFSFGLSYVFSNHIKLKY